MQAVSLDIDMMEKVNMVLGGMFGRPGADPQKPAPGPKTRLEEIAELKKLGFTVKRA